MNFCTDLEECCAAANDFVRMTEECDTIVEELLEHTELNDLDIQTVQEVANELLRQFTNDAVYAAQAIHVFIMEPIVEELQDKLFVSEEWNDPKGERVHALTLVRTMEDYLGDVSEWMEEVMVRKCVDGLVRASVNYYIGQLLLLAYTVKDKNKKAAVFDQPGETMKLIQNDVNTIRSYFENLAQESFPSLKRGIMDEFAIMTTIFGIVYMANEWLKENEKSDDYNLEEDADQHASFFPRLFQSLDYNLELTRTVLGDLYSIVGGWDAERAIYEIWESPHGEEPLRALEQDSSVNHNIMSSSSTEGTMLNLNKYLQTTLGKEERKRPIKKEGFWSNYNTTTKEEQQQQQEEFVAAVAQASQTSLRETTT